MRIAVSEFRRCAMPTTSGSDAALARARLHTFQKHVLRVRAAKIMTDMTHLAKAAAAVEICTQCTAVLHGTPRQKVIVPIVAALPDIRPYVTPAEVMNYSTSRTQFREIRISIRQGLFFGTA